MDFWWELWPEHNDVDDLDDLSQDEIDRMWDAFTTSWDEGVRDPDTFFDALRALGYTIHDYDWDEWRDWYDAL